MKKLGTPKAVRNFFVWALSSRWPWNVGRGARRRRKEEEEGKKKEGEKKQKQKHKQKQEDRKSRVVYLFGCLDMKDWLQGCIVRLFWLRV